VKSNNNAKRDITPAKKCDCFKSGKNMWWHNLTMAKTQEGWFRGFVRRNTMP
jgi:hypothetical protein